MQTIKLHSRVGADGILTLEVPLDLTNTELEVLLVLHPIAATKIELNGWSADFFSATYGSLRDDTLLRPDQGDYGVRDELE